MSSKPTVALALSALFAASALSTGSVSPIETASARNAIPTIQRTIPRIGQTPRPGLPFGADFFEDFDSYAVGSNVHGQGGWKGWLNDPSSGAFVDDAFSVSPTNSINITGPSDLVHEFSGYTSGFYTITAKQYIPSDFSGDSYFIFENVYSDTDQSVISWSTQVVFHSATGTVDNETGAADPGSLPFVTGEWADLKLEVDLDNDIQTFYYNGDVLYSGSWTEQFPNQDVPGILNIGSIDLFANGASPVYYDDISIVAGIPSDFGVDVTADTTEMSGAPGSTVTYDVTLTNTGSTQDTFDITVASVGGWVVTPSESSVTLDAAASTTISVDVEVSAVDPIGTLDTETVTATSEGDGSVSDTLGLTTTIAADDTIFADGFDSPPPG